jgi:hypothetical protein
LSTHAKRICVEEESIYIKIIFNKQMIPSIYFLGDVVALIRNNSNNNSKRISKNKSGY